MLTQIVAYNLGGKHGSAQGRGICGGSFAFDVGCGDRAYSSYSSYSSHSGSDQPVDRPAAQTRAARCTGRTNRIIPGQPAFAGADGIDLSAGGGAGRSLAHRAQESEGRATKDRGGQTGLG